MSDPVIINQHNVSGLEPTIKTVGERNRGGAYTAYDICDPTTGEVVVRIPFQSQPTSKGCNGVLDITLLEIVVHRMRGFQAGPFASGHGEDTLLALYDAIAHQVDRTKARMARGVHDQQKK